MDKNDLGRTLGVAPNDIVDVEEVDGKTYVRLNTGTIKCLNEKGNGWTVVDRIPRAGENKADEVNDKDNEEQRGKSDAPQSDVDYDNQDENAAVPGGARDQADRVQNQQVLSETELDATKTRGKGKK